MPQSTPLSKFSLVLIVFASLLTISAINTMAGDMELTGTKTIDYGAKPTSFVSLFDDPSNSSANSNSVNLYTGQHSESFPLVSISGRGGLGVSLSLDYNGNIGHIIRAENRKTQVSPFGLGFSMNTESIISNSWTTSNIYDDDYSLVLGGAIVKLVPTDDYYVPENGDPWIITKDTATFRNRLAVIGWTIKKEDGTVLRFGDHDTTYANWNATRNILRYGSFVGAGVTDDDEPYPHQWDLKVVHDPDSLNTVEFVYTRDLARLEVMDSLGSLDSSGHQYVRASYIDTIKTTEGHKAHFTYSSRDCVQPFYGLNNYEFYQSTKADEIQVLSSDDSILSKICFTYDTAYFNHHRSSNLKKLKLTRIERKSADDSLSAPPLKFYYNLAPESPGFGSVRWIGYPSGASKKVHYKELDDSANFTKLDTMVFDDSSCFLAGQVTVTNNQFYSLGSFHPFAGELGVWDGYWQTRLMNDLGGNYQSNAGLSPEGWLAASEAYSPSGGHLFKVYSWAGGYWDTMSVSDSIWSHGSVRVYPGRDCFVSVTGGGVDGFRNTHFFRFDGSEWVKYLIANSSTEIDFSGAKVVNTTYAVSYSNQGNGALRFGKYDFETDSLCAGFIQGANWNLGTKFAVSSDVVAACGDSGLFLWRWDDANHLWDETYLTDGQPSEYDTIWTSVMSYLHCRII